MLPTKASTPDGSPCVLPSSESVSAIRKTIQEISLSHLQSDLLHCGEVSALPVDAVRLQQVALLDLGDALGDEVRHIRVAVVPLA